MKDNKKKYLIVGIIIAIIAVIAVIFSSTYAYWQLTRKQTSPNDVVALCLDLSIENETGTFGLSKAWPISDEEGKTLEGLTFTVKNNCDKPINYIVGLNSVQTETNDNYMSYDSIKVMIDERTPLLYGDLGKVEYANAEDTSVVRDSRQLSLETIEGGATNTHNVKAWVDINSDVSNQGKTFSGKIFITGGQGIYGGDDCYKIASNGTIWGYDDACTMNVNVPEKINDIPVKTINKASFTNADVYLATLTNKHTNNNTIVVVHLNNDIIDEVNQALLGLVCSDLDNCEISNISDVATVYNSYEDYTALDLSNYKVASSSVYKYNVNNSNLEDINSQVKHLNLGDAIQLEKIENESFLGRWLASSNLCDGKETIRENKEDYCDIGALESLALPQNGALTTIGESAFGYNVLKNVSIPDTVNNIGQKAFIKNEIVNVKLSNGVNVIPSSLFRYNEIEEILIPDNVTEISDYAFSHNMLTEVKIPAAVARIGVMAFAHDYYQDETGAKINKLTIENTDEKPSQLKIIDDSAFINNDISKINLPNGFEEIGRSAFYGNLINELFVPASVRRIEDDAFYNNKMTKVVFEDTEENPSQLIYLSGFGSNEITDLKVPRKVTTIGSSAFNGIKSSGTIVLPSTVTDIGSYAFHSLTLKEIVIKKANSTGMTLGSNWYRESVTKITYNPDYTE